MQFDEEFLSQAALPLLFNLFDKLILRLGRSHNSQVWCELTRNSPHKRGSPLDTCSPKAIRCYPASPCTDNTVILLLSGTTRKNNTICRYCGLSPIRWPPPPCFALFIHLHVPGVSKQKSAIFGLADQILDKGDMDDGMPIEAVPNQLCSKHNSNETFVLPENGKSRMENLFIFSGCASTKSGRFPVQNLCFCRNKLEGLRPSYEGDFGEGGLQDT